MKFLFQRYGTTVPIFCPKSPVRWNRIFIKEKMLFLFGSGGGSFNGIFYFSEIAQNLNSHFFKFSADCGIETDHFCFHQHCRTGWKKEPVKNLRVSSQSPSNQNPISFGKSTLFSNPTRTNLLLNCFPTFIIHRL